VGLRLAKGRCLLHKKDSEGALAEFRTVLRSTADTVAFNGAVHACLMLRRFPEARLHARAALAALPGSASAQYLLGCVLVQAPGERAADAERHMLRALQLDPSHKEAALVVVNMMQQRQEWDAAAAILKQQLLLHPTDALHVRLGQVYRCAEPSCAAEWP
jgi:tetratricopeptide (TPR) repeat protein